MPPVSERMALDPLHDVLGQHHLAGGEDLGLEEVAAHHLAGGLRAEDVQVRVDAAARARDEVPLDAEQVERPLDACAPACAARVIGRCAPAWMSLKVTFRTEPMAEIMTPCLSFDLARRRARSARPAGCPAGCA